MSTDDFQARLALDGEAPCEGSQNPIADTGYDNASFEGGSVDGEPEYPVGNRREDRTSAGR